MDSTRAGKRIPDALSKTIPIWCAVVNRAMRLRCGPLPSWDTALYTPPRTVSSQEHSQIEARLDSWAQDLAVSSHSPLVIGRRAFTKTPLGFIHPRVPRTASLRFLVRFAHYGSRPQRRRFPLYPQLPRRRLNFFLLSASPHRGRFTTASSGVRTVSRMSRVPAMTTSFGVWSVLSPPLRPALAARPVMLTLRRTSGAHTTALLGA